MNKHFAISAILLISFNSAVFANNLDADTITFIHAKTKSTMADFCKKKMTGMTDAVCNCVGEKAQANLNDNVLKKCSSTDKSGRHCIEQAVENASITALSKDSIQACTTGQNQGQPAATPAAANTSSSTAQPAAGKKT